MTLASASSRIAQVLMTIRSADSIEGDSVTPAARSLPAISSESLRFIWQPSVHTWKLGSAALTGRYSRKRASRGRDGAARQPRDLDRAAYPDRPRDRARDRQHRVHLDPGRKAPAGAAGARTNDRTRPRDGDADLPAPHAVLGDRTHGSPAHPARSGAFGARSDPHRRRPVPAGQGDARDPRDTRGRGRARGAQRQRVIALGPLPDRPARRRLLA